MKILVFVKECFQVVGVGIVEDNEDNVDKLKADYIKKHFEGYNVYDDDGIVVIDGEDEGYFSIVEV